MDTSDPHRKGYRKGIEKDHIYASIGIQLFVRNIILFGMYTLIPISLGFNLEQLQYFSIGPLRTPNLTAVKDGGFIA